MVGKAPATRRTDWGQAGRAQKGGVVAVGRSRGREPSDATAAVLSPAALAPSPLPSFSGPTRPRPRLSVCFVFEAVSNRRARPDTEEIRSILSDLTGPGRNEEIRGGAPREQPIYGAAPSRRSLSHLAAPFVPFLHHLSSASGHSAACGRDASAGVAAGAFPGVAVSLSVGLWAKSGGHGGPKKKAHTAQTV